MIRRKTRTIEYRNDSDGGFTVFRLPWEAIVYDHDLGRQAVKDRIDDRREELATIACDLPDERLIWDDTDRSAVRLKIKAGKSVV